MTPAQRYTVFGTDAGFVAIAWNARGVTGLRLPSSSEASAQAAILRRQPSATRAVPDGALAAVIARIQRYFSGEKVDFADVPVDLGEQAPFFDTVYARVRDLGWGETTTYGAVAKALGAQPQAARDVGQAMAANPVPLIVPCHRVLAAGGKIGGFSAPGGSGSKARMLQIEGVAVADGNAAPPPEPPRQAAFDF
jgi:methylated-DNA-[protein]-cysteine S-methyltransferase